MTTNLVLAVTIGALFATGVYLMLSRNLIRVILGFLLAGHGINLLLLTTGVGGVPPIVGEAQGGEQMADPVPQALILTSIVISFAVTAFMLGIIYRTWVLARQDEIQDDAEDRRVAETPSFDAEDDSVIPVETSEFPLATVMSGDRPVRADKAASEEQPGSLNVDPSPEGGGE
jgi:multicomponent Na+:H+ antiporter subunit C